MVNLHATLLFQLRITEGFKGSRNLPKIRDRVRVRGGKGVRELPGIDMIASRKGKKRARKREERAEREACVQRCPRGRDVLEEWPKWTSRRR